MIASPIDYNLSLQDFSFVFLGGSFSDGESETIATICGIDSGTVYAFHVNNCSIGTFGNWGFRIYYDIAYCWEQIRMSISEEKHSF